MSVGQIPAHMVHHNISHIGAEAAKEGLIDASTQVDKIGNYIMCKSELKQKLSDNGHCYSEFQTITGSHQA